MGRFFGFGFGVYMAVAVLRSGRGAHLALLIVLALAAVYLGGRRAGARATATADATAVATADATAVAQAQGGSVTVNLHVPTYQPTALDRAAGWTPDQFMPQVARGAAIEAIEASGLTVVDGMLVDPDELEHEDEPVQVRES